MEQDTRDRLLDAAERIYAQKGTRGMTTRAVAAEAGVSELTLFRHFGNKQSLLEAVAQRFSNVSRIERVLAEADSGDLFRDLCYVAHNMMAGIREIQDVVRMAIAEVGTNPEATRLTMLRPRNAVQRLGAFFAERMERGQVRRDDPLLMAHAFSGMFLARQLARPMFEGLITQPEDEIIESFVRFFVNGIAAGQEDGACGIAANRGEAREEKGNGDSPRG